MQFELILKNEKVKFYNGFTFFIALLNAAVLSFIAYNSTGFKTSVAITYIAVFVIAYSIEFLYKKKSGARNLLRAGILLLAALSWAVLQEWLFSFANIALFFFYIIATRKLIVSVDPQKITFPSFPQKEISWQQLNNAVLKDGLLTIDFKNNKLFQGEMQNSKAGVNEQEFNDFCSVQLKK